MGSFPQESKALYHLKPAGHLWLLGKNMYCIPRLADKSCWSVSGWNWLQRGWCTRNLLVIAGWLHWGWWLVCKHSLTNHQNSTRFFRQNFPFEGLCHLFYEFHYCWQVQIMGNYSNLLVITSRLSLRHHIAHCNPFPLETASILHQPVASWLGNVYFSRWLTRGCWPASGLMFPGTLASSHGPNTGVRLTGHSKLGVSVSLC